MGTRPANYIIDVSFLFRRYPRVFLRAGTIRPLLIELVGRTTFFRPTCLFSDKRRALLPLGQAPPLAYSLKRLLPLCKGFATFVANSFISVSGLRNPPRSQPNANKPNSPLLSSAPSLSFGRYLLSPFQRGRRIHACEILL